MDAHADCRVITAAAAVAEGYGLLQSHLTVTRPPGTDPPPLAEQRCYKIHPDAALAVIEAITNVATVANPGSTEA